MRKRNFACAVPEANRSLLDSGVEKVDGHRFDSRLFGCEKVTMPYLAENFQPVNF